MIQLSKKMLIPSKAFDEILLELTACNWLSTTSIILNVNACLYLVIKHSPVIQNVLQRTAAGLYSLLGGNQGQVEPLTSLFHWLVSSILPFVIAAHLCYMLWMWYAGLRIQSCPQEQMDP